MEGGYGEGRGIPHLWGYIGGTISLSITKKTIGDPHVLDGL